jgi:hypothetical protein
MLFKIGDKMKNKEKYIGAVWFGKTGIVLMNNGYEDKAYIGAGNGEDEQKDIQTILRSGIPFSVHSARLMINNKKPETMQDILSAEEIEVKIRNDGKVMWINTEKGCILRINKIKNLIIEDGRKL